MKYGEIPPFLAQRIFNTPLAIDPKKAQVILAVLRERGLPINTEATDPPSSSTNAERMPYRVVNGTAVIPVFGTLVHRTMGLNALSGLTSYASLEDKLDTALADTSVDRVLFVIDSPGGEVDGLFDLTDKIFAARKKKSMMALADSMATSAAYAIGSATEHFHVTQQAVTGSIGVILEHVDFSQANAAEGITVTEIYAGSHKADGSPNRPLDEPSLAALADMVNRYYALFVDKVAGYRGLSTESIRKTEAGIYVGADAMRLHLVDSVTTLDALLTRSERESNMEQMTVATLTAAHGDVVAQLQAEARKDAISAERARILEVLEVADVSLSVIVQKAIADGTDANALARAILAERKSTQTTIAKGVLSESPAPVDSGATETGTPSTEHRANVRDIGKRLQAQREKQFGLAR